MAEWVTDGATILFEPDPGWSWSGWNGKLTLAAPDRGLGSEEKPVGLAEDAQRLAAKLQGKSYTASGFADTPGTVLMAVVSVQLKTLDAETTCDGKGIMLSTTEGKFTLSCIPSIKAGSPPLPDPVPAKSGRWSVEIPGQKSATSG